MSKRTTELIKEEEKNLLKLKEDMQNLKKAIQASERKLQSLRKTEKVEKLTLLAEKLESKGASVEDILNAFENDDILSLIKDNAQSKDSSTKSEAAKDAVTNDGTDDEESAEPVNRQDSAWG